MSRPMKAGVIVKTRFVDKSVTKNGKLAESFLGYIKYIDRNEAVRNENFTRYNLSSQYAKYNDYMGNPEKTGGIFTETLNSLDESQKQELKQAFKMGFDNDSIMWQTVISFDNRFLAQLGIYNPETGVLDEGALQTATRRMMREALKQENMQHSAVWSAAIHYNTDNIHIHIAYTEPTCTRQKKTINGVERPKGYFSAKTFRQMKSKVVNTLLENNYSILDEYLRDKLVGSRKQIFAPEDVKLRDLWYRIYDNLPTDKRQWNYNMNGIAQLRPLLDELSRQYIMAYRREDFTAFQKQLMHQQGVFQAVYGVDSQYKHFAENKIKTLYEKMGNVALAEMRAYSRYEFSELLKQYGGFRSAQGAYVLGRLKSALNKAFSDSTRQNIKEHKQLEAAIQQEANNDGRIQY